jgi:hypothetical protein
MKGREPSEELRKSRFYVNYDSREEMEVRVYEVILINP